MKGRRLTVQYVVRASVSEPTRTARGVGAPAREREGGSAGAKPPGAGQDGGWTLIELLVVLSIILILAAMALTQYRNSVQYAKEAALRSDLYLMRDAIDQYYADKGKYPETLDALVTDRYLRAIPRDPITASTDTWQTEQAERDAGAVASQAGIINVKSGSPDTALDGSRYGEW